MDVRMKYLRRLAQRQAEQTLNISAVCGREAAEAATQVQCLHSAARIISFTPFISYIIIMWKTCFPRIHRGEERVEFSYYY